MPGVHFRQVVYTLYYIFSYVDQNYLQCAIIYYNILCIMQETFATKKYKRKKYFISFPRFIFRCSCKLFEQLQIIIRNENKGMFDCLIKYVLHS